MIIFTKKKKKIIYRVKGTVYEFKYLSFLRVVTRRGKLSKILMPA